MRARKLDVLALRSNRSRQERPGPSSNEKGRCESDEIAHDDKPETMASSREEVDVCHPDKLAAVRSRPNVGNQQEDDEEDGAQDWTQDIEEDDNNDEDVQVREAMQALQNESQREALVMSNEEKHPMHGVDAEKSGALLTSMDQVLVGLDTWQLERQRKMQELEASLAQESALEERRIAILAEESEDNDHASSSLKADERMRETDALQRRFAELAQQRPNDALDRAGARVLEGVTSKERNFASLRRDIAALGQDFGRSEAAQLHTSSIGTQAQEELEGVMNLQAQLDAFASDLDAFLLESPLK